MTETPSDLREQLAEYLYQVALGLVGLGIEASLVRALYAQIANEVTPFVKPVAAQGAQSVQPCEECRDSIPVNSHGYHLLDVGTYVKCVAAQGAPSQQVQCWHKECDEKGICKNCGAKARIVIEGMPANRQPVDMPRVQDKAAPEEKIAQGASQSIQGLPNREKMQGGLDVLLQIQSWIRGCRIPPMPHIERPSARELEGFIASLHHQYEQAVAAQGAPDPPRKTEPSLELNLMEAPIMPLNGPVHFWPPRSQ